jgi:surface carbohydrate biosynthesis protein
MGLFKRALRIWRRLGRLLLARKIWRWPKKSEVLVFDAVGVDILLQYFGDWNPAVLCIRGEEINVPILLASLLRRGSRAQDYVDIYIEYVKPKIVVTFIDNDVDFMSIRKRHPSLKTVIVQNGWKSFYSDIFEALDGLGPARRAALQVDYLLTFGQVIGDEYSRYLGCTVIPVGSVKNNHVACTQPAVPGAIAFISQWHPEGFLLAGKLCSHEAFFRQVDQLILRCLVEYASITARQLLIVPRNVEGSSERLLEEAYYCDMVGPKCCFAPRKGQFPSYAAVDAAEVVVAVDTTLGYEAIARGRKTAMFSIRSAMLGMPGLTYGWPGRFPDDGPFWTNRPDPLAFVRVLDYLFNVESSQWAKDVEATGFSSLMIYNPGNSTLKSVIKKELGLQLSAQASNHSCSMINPS